MRRIKKCAFVILFICCFGILFVILTQILAKTPEIRDEKGEKIENSIAELKKVELNGRTEWISIRGNNQDNPVLLFLAGGPGGSQMAAVRYDLAELEKHFVVVNWDQPGSAKSYHAARGENITVDTYIEDGIALSRYLCERFQQEKIFLVGESWGSALGIFMADRQPELYYSFVGTGQMIDFLETENIDYDNAVILAQKKGDLKKLERLEKNGRPPYYGKDVTRKSAEYLQYLSNEMARNPEIHNGGYNTFRDLFASEYGVWDKINYLRGILNTFNEVYPQLYEIDLREDYPSLEVPVHFFLGRHDINAPAALVEEYAALLDAPSKEIVWFEHSGHSPWINESDKFVQQLLRVKEEDLQEERLQEETEGREKAYEKVKEDSKVEAIAEVNEKKEVSAQGQTPSGILLEDLEAYCDAVFLPALENTLPGASIAVVSQGEIVFEKGYGYADVEKQIPADPKRTVYEYGSVSKLITWSSVMKLYEQGRLDLNTDIRGYLPEDFVLPLSYEKPITLLQLMNHQGGFGDYLIHLFSKEKDLTGLREALEENKVDQYYEPGFASSYSNYGAALAGYIVECVSGMPMYQYAWEEIMAPAGMNTATLNPDLTANPQIKAEKAKVYEYVAGAFQEQNATYVPMYPAGAGNGTVEALAHFAQALLEEETHPVFERYETQQEMLSTSYQAAEGVPGMAHGFVEYDGEYPVYWHNGGTDHSSTFFAIVPEQDFGVVICTNTGSKGLGIIQKLGFDMVKKQQPFLEEQTVAEKLPDVKLVEGDYLDFREDRKGLLRIEAFSRYFSPHRVRAVNENRITIDGQLYTQIKPYIFRNDEDGTKCAFVVENGKVVKYSRMLDYLPVTLGTRVIVYTQAAVLALLVLAIVGGIGFCVLALVRRSAGLDHGIVFCMILLWGAIVANMLHMVNLVVDWVPFSTVRGSVVVNCILGALLAVCGVVGIVRKAVLYRGSTKHKLTVAYVQQLSFYITSVVALAVCWSLGMFCLWK